MEMELLTASAIVMETWVVAEAAASGCDTACGSTLENDECGVCGGDEIDDGECDCDGNVLLGNTH